MIDSCLLYTSSLHDDGVLERAHAQRQAMRLSPITIHHPALRPHNSSTSCTHSCSHRACCVTDSSPRMAACSTWPGSRPPSLQGTRSTSAPRSGRLRTQRITLCLIASAERQRGGSRVLRWAARRARCARRQFARRAAAHRARTHAGRHRGRADQPRRARPGNPGARRRPAAPRSARVGLEIKSKISRNGSFFAGSATRAQISSEIRSLKPLPNFE